jgi:glycosyltransferase involved in cell wall biosynthesis
VTVIRGHANDPFQIGELVRVSVRENGQNLEHRLTEKAEHIREARADSRVDPKGGLEENGKKNAIESAIGDFRIPSRPRFDLLYIIGCHEGESKRYRVHNLASSIGALGYRVESWPQEKIQALIREQFSARVVVLFRCAFDEGIDEMIRYCRENGITSIFDVDDLVFEPESTDYVRVLQSFSEAERKQYDAGVVQYRRSLIACDRATATTNFLSRRIQAIGIPSDVIPNSLNRRQVEMANAILANPLNQRKEVRIGYFSGSNTHQTDFQACEAALLTVMERHSQVRFILVGLLDLGRQWDSLSDRIERHPFLPYEQMLGLLSTIDINLAPLELGNPYCESKSQLKIFEAGVVSVPTIATMIESYKEAITHGKDGMLAGNIEDWTSALEGLVQSPELRLRMGRLARERAMAQFGPDVVVRKALEVYQLPPLQERSGIGSDKRLKITWIIPGLEIGSGGHRNILRAAYFLEQFGHEIELYFTGINLSGEQLRESVHAHFYPLHGAMHSYVGSINQTDVLFATHWTTVEVAMKARDAAGEIMYFVQDFEPAFAAVGTEYILAENTYRLGLYHITSGPWCEAVLRRDFGCEADHFMFPVDRRIYHPKARKKSNANVVFFARPEMPRRCFDLGVQALESFHQLSPDVEIILFGSKHISESTLPFAATVKSLLPRIQDLAQLYADADLGIAFSTTNPSLVPYEMMACGLPVVDLGRPGNELNYGGRKDIAFLADPMPPKLGRQIHELLNDRGQLASRSKKGLEFVQSFPSEEEMARRIERLIIKRIASRETKAQVATRG